MKTIIVDDADEQGDRSMFFINQQTVGTPDVGRAGVPN
jgi:hypothetical protein